MIFTDNLFFSLASSLYPSYSFFCLLIVSRRDKAKVHSFTLPLATINQKGINDG